ncbi:hypothetical protein M640_p00260 (plasmid) [Listeria monocytogenes]|nr:hypothetical protein M640_p00260 [Listeria monocytogenes]AGT07093.1 hypothetical protein M644_p00295 [Listeria monocytogenes]AGT07159.1 hypothetical protein M645_p00265 [Listeria monocytogenes]
MFFYTFSVAQNQHFNTSFDKLDYRVQQIEIFTGGGL